MINCNIIIVILKRSDYNALNIIKRLEMLIYN